MLSLTKLAELARDTSAKGRRGLVATLTDMFLATDNDRVEEVSLIFGDIVMKVLGQLEDEARMALAKRVSHHDAAPHDVMVKLAQDSIEIARPVLSHSTVLSTDDLAEIAATASMEHLNVIAGRPVVEEKVTSVLVDRGDETVLTTVAENKGARFNPESFDRLVHKARNIPQIQAALMARADLPKDAARSLVPFLSGELTERIKDLGADNTLVEVLAERAAEEVAARARRLEDDHEQTRKLIADVQAGTRKVDDAVSMFAKSDRAAELGMLLAKVSDLPVAGVSKLIYSKSDKALIILCKANDVSGDAYKSVLTMRAKRLGMSGHELNDAIKRYASMSKSGAVRSLEAIQEASNAEKAKNAPAPKKSNVPFAVNR